MGAPTFRGFPARSGRCTPIPNLFFTSVLPAITDIDELRVTLGLFWRLSWKKGYPRFVTSKELESDPDLIAGLAAGGQPPAQALRRGLEKAVARGTFLSLELSRDGAAHRMYLLNTEVDRLAAERIRQGQLDVGGLPKLAAPTPPERRDIFTLYEENIGVLSPLIIEDLKEAEEAYPPPWIEEAFKEAVRLNNRRWKYIRAILENWKAEGRPDGRDRRHPQNAPGAGQAPERQRGGYIVKRTGA